MKYVNVVGEYIKKKKKLKLKALTAPAEDLGSISSTQHGMATHNCLKLQF